MADIELTRTHSKGIDDGRQTVEAVAQKMKDKIGVQYEWDDNNTLVFDGQGAEGRITVQAETIQILIHLSAFLRPMKEQLREKAEAYLDERLEA